MCCYFTAHTDAAHGYTVCVAIHAAIAVMEVLPYASAWICLCVCPTIINTSICRVGQNRISVPYMTVCMVISLPIIPYIHRIYL